MLGLNLPTLTTSSGIYTLLMNLSRFTRPALVVLVLSCVSPCVMAQQWREMDYGPFLTTTIEVDRENIAYKAIAIRLDEGAGGVAAGSAFVAFDTDTLRYAALWTGPGMIDWRSVVYDGSHTTHPSLVGQRMFVNPVGPGWADPDRGSFTDSRLRGVDGRAYGSLNHPWGKWKGLYRHAHRTVLAYTIGTTEILDAPSLEPGDGGPFIARTIEIGSRQHDLILQVAALAGCRAQVRREPASLGSIWRVATLTRESTREDSDVQGTADRLRLTGAEHLVVTASEDLDMTDTDFSVTAAIRSTEGGTIFSQAAPSGPWVPNGKTIFIRDGRLCYDIGWVGTVQSQSRVNDGNWHDIAVTYQASAGEVRLYVDGTLQGQGRLKPAAKALNQIVRIGYTAVNFPEPQSAFTGDLREVRFYQCRLDEAEVKHPGNLREEKLRGEWQLADVAEGRLRDASGHGHDAVLTQSAGAATHAAGLAVVCVGIEQPDWLTAPDGSLQLRIAKGPSPLRLKLLFAQLDPEQNPTGLIEHAGRATPPEDLTPLLDGGPRQWPESLETGIQPLGNTNGPFAVESLTLPDENPWRSWLRLGGLDFFADGDRAAVCSWQGDVWIVSGLAGTSGRLSWQRTASGLFQPLGLKIVDEQIYVLGRDQITRLHDVNGDGETDFYENFNNDAQVTDHFHEFAMDLQTDKEGNFYYLKAARHALPAVVPQHGTLLQVSRDGSQTRILARGFRAPDGLLVNDDGTFLNSDQEGHWTPMNRINWIRPGGFYGNMMAANPQQVAVDATDRPVCWIHREMDRSPTAPVWVPHGQWGSLEGALLCLSYGTGKTWRVLYEQVGDVVQGGIVLLPIPEFPTGIQRGRFHPRDGMLYVCGLFGWSSDKTLSGGLYRIRYTGAVVRVPDSLSVTRNGVLLHFPLPLDAQTAADRHNYVVSRWNYQRSENYGSGDYRVSDGKPGRDPVPVSQVSVSHDRQSVFLHIRDMVACMQMRIQYGLQEADGEAVAGIVDHTVHVLPEPTAELRESFDDRLILPDRPDAAVRRDASVEPGLVMRIESSRDGVTYEDARVVRMVAWRAVAEESPTVFVPPGSLVARWDGFVKSDLAATITLRAEFVGALTVDVNGEAVIQSESPRPQVVASAAMMLHAGLNSFSVRLASLPDSQAAIRLLWQRDNDVAEPLRAEVLVHDPEAIAALATQQRLRLGRELVGRYRCGRCHATGASGAMPELNVDLPSLAGVADRLTTSWLNRWIRDPQSMRNDITMPHVLRASDEREIADLVAYLDTLHSEDAPVSDSASEDGDDHDAVQRGMVLYEDLGCIGCHHWESPDFEDPYQRTTLRYVRAKYRPGMLFRFLRNPHEHFASRRMPDFRLSADEAGALATYLRSKSAPLEGSSNALGDAQRGKKSFEDRGCIACHVVNTEAALPTPSAQPLFSLRDVSRGCLARDDSQRATAPQFSLSDEQRNALIPFLGTDGTSLTRYVPAEAAERFVQRLRCAVCHRRDGELPILPEVLAEEGEQGYPAEFLPPLTWTGEKLQSDWVRQMLTGKLAYQTRPWKRGRMSAFPSYAEVLADGLAAQHGMTTEPNPQESPDMSQARLGQRLTEQNQGFNCLQCHGLPGQPPEAPFESRGIDFHRVSNRLRKDFYRRWIGNPIQFDPAVPMPRFSPDGQTTPAQRILDGNAQRQFDAIWQYLQTLRQ